MVSWAEDTVLLEPYNLKRNFYRIEFHPDTGDERMLVSEGCEHGRMT
jgi:hypothetical protein